METLNNITLISPKTISEVLSAMNKTSEYRLFAGGTQIMSQPDYYPHKEKCDYIALSSIPELRKIVYSDTFIEVGSMVTIQQLLQSGSYAFTKVFRNALKRVGTDILRSQITIGGCLCCPDKRFPISCILAAVGAIAEIRSVSISGLIKHMKVKTKWVPISKLYDENGKYLYPNNALMTKIRIPDDKSKIQVFSTIGNPQANPDNSISMALEYNIIQDNVESPSFCLSLIKNGFMVDSEFNNLLKSMTFPLSTGEIHKISKELERYIEGHFPSVTVIQKERARRLMISTLFEANNNYLSS